MRPCAISTSAVATVRAIHISNAATGPPSAHHPRPCVCRRDAAGLIRMYNPKGAGGQLRCVQVLRPQLLDEAFLRSSPDFWERPATEQVQLVAEAFGPGRSLELPYEVVAGVVVFVVDFNRHNVCVDVGNDKWWQLTIPLDLG